MQLTEIIQNDMFSRLALIVQSTVLFLALGILQHWFVAIGVGEFPRLKIELYFGL